jgi:3,4-dihydroxy-9,10-secoandrosta-1,3,5(10)-triene-9,17-dione 4,5-dioxygenase
MADQGVSLVGLGYAGVSAPDPKGWRDFATEVCGLTPAHIVPGARQGGIPIPSPDAEGLAADGSVYLKMDRRQWRVAVHPSEQAGLAYLGFEVKSVADFERAVETISSQGVSIRPGSAEELQARSVERLAVLEDPFGHRFEIFLGPIVDEIFQSPKGIEFLIGDLGMGHAVLYVPDAAQAVEFYRDVLGFQRSDYMTFGPDGMGIHFLRCTPRHHSLAVVQVGDLTGLQHLMFEATTLDAVGKALDRATARGVPITSGLGRHRNDKTVSFYMQGPSGFDIEMGWDGLIVGEDWVEHEFAGGGDEWGHHGLDADALKPRD